MNFGKTTGQSAIEYLMTYGWMLLVVAVVGGAIFATVNQESPNSVTGFTGSNVQVDDFGVTSDDDLQLNLRSSTGQEATVTAINVTDEENGKYVYKEFSENNSVDVGSELVFNLPNVSKAGTGNLDAEIKYNSGGLKNLTASGSITGGFEVESTVETSDTETGGSLSLLTTETYTFTGSKETIDLNNDFSEPVEEIKILEMHGADGSQGDNAGGNDGSGGYIANATADVSSYSTLEIWVGEGYNLSVGSYVKIGGWGRSNGGDGETGTYNGGGGGGSTEIRVDGNLVAAADGGGGGGAQGDYGGGGGARGGLGASDGTDAQGTGNGGDGSLNNNNNAEDGGQELGLATLDSDGAVNKGGSNDGDGEIILEYYG